MSKPIAVQVSDRNLNTFTTSAKSLHQQSEVAISQAEALNALTATSITTFERTARRFGYGTPQRILVETDGPVLLQSYLSPSSVVGGEEGNRNAYLSDLLDVGRPSTTASHQTNSTELANPERPSYPLKNGFGTPHLAMPGVEENLGDESMASQPPPNLYATVVARRADLREARIALTNIERVSRRLQQEWLMEENMESVQATKAGSTNEDVNV